MPRVARIYTEEGIFHILTRGNNRQTVFHDEEDFNIYKERLIELKKEHSFKLYHYCLMSNHVHLVIETDENTELSKLMKRLNLSYYNHYKKKYKYNGHFWRDRFKSLLIDKDDYLLSCGLYVERNPVRANMVKDAKEYEYSSYNNYAYGKRDKLVDNNPSYNKLGKDDNNKQKEYRRLMKAGDGNLDSNIFNRLYLGKEEFVKKMEDKFGIKNVRAERGRPKKANK